MREVQEEFYDNGNIRIRFEYICDKLDGKCEEFYLSNKIKRISNWKKGELDGLSVFFYPNGKHAEKSKWKNGKRLGLSEWFDTDGMLERREFYKDDNLIETSNIIVKKLTDIQIVKDITKHCWNIESSASLKSWYKTGHSPLYSQIFFITCTIPKSVMEQLRTHEKNGMVFYSSSGRPDTGTESGNTRESPRNVCIFCNAGHILSMAHKRLCLRAEQPTRDFMQQLKDEINRIDPDLASLMVPNCEYLKACPEVFGSCKKGL